MSNIEIVEVKNNENFVKFVDFPWQVYKNLPNWVPPVKADMKKMLSIKNPFFHHSKKKLYLAYKNGILVGRIAGIIDYNFCEFQNQKTGFFGFLEAINDYEVAKSLFDTVKKFMLENNITKILGPANPSTNDEMGWCLDNYDLPPYLMMPYNPSYYHELAEKYGFKKAKDLNAFKMDVQNFNISRLKKINEIVKSKHPGINIRSINFSNFEKEVNNALSIYNLAWEKNWGFVPWTKEEFRAIAENLKNFLLPETALIAEKDDKPIGMMIAVPNYNIIIKKANGSMLKLLWYFFTQRKKIKKIRVMILGVIKEYRKQGIEGLMYLEGLVKAKKMGFTESEFSWILEDNLLTNRTCEMMGGKLYKKYRVYELDL